MPKSGSFSSSPSRGVRFTSSDAPPCGRLELIIGPMFAGKSTELIRRTRRYARTRKRCLVIKFKGDTRYSVEQLSTHDSVMMDAEACTKLSQVDHLLDAFDVVAIDEGQFFPDLLDFSDKVANLGKIVIVAALDADYLRKPFGDIIQLVPRAELITKLSAVCSRCVSDAHFTLRTVASTEQNLIGGAEMYEPVCRACYLAGIRTAVDRGDRVVNAVSRKVRRAMNLSDGEEDTIDA